MIDDVMKKQIGYWLMSLMAAFGLALGDWVVAMGWKPLWVVFILAVWYATDVLIFALMQHYFKIEKKDQTI